MPLRIILVQIAGVPMQCSARNQLTGTVSNIAEGAVGAVVTVSLSPSYFLRAYITMESLHRLDLSVNDQVVAVFDANDVSVASSYTSDNALAGTIYNIEEGAVSAIVTVNFGNFTITGNILKDCVGAMGLSTGGSCTVCISPFDVAIGV